MGKDYYKILGVPKDVSPDQLKKAYLKLALAWHPDKQTGKTKEQKLEAENKFKDIAEAFDVLRDPEKKKIYDTFGEKGLKGGVGPADAANFSSAGGPNVRTYVYTGVDAADLFSQFFGRNSQFFDDDMGIGGDMGSFMGGSPFEMSMGGMGHEAFGRSSAPPPKQYFVDLKVTLEDLYKGEKKKLKVTRQRFSGHSRRAEEKILEIAIKPGWKDGTKITFAGEGDQESPSKPPGDVVFVVKTQPHPQFVRNGDHLIYSARITLAEALTGTKIPVSLLDGRKLLVNCQPVINPKYRKIVANGGMPNSKTGERGDLIIEFDIIFPQHLSPEVAQSIARLLVNSQ